MDNPKLPRGAQSLPELRIRAGNPSPKYKPVIADVRPGSRPGWLAIDVSLEPGNRVTYQIPAQTYDPGTIAAIIESATSIYRPAGLSVDLYTQEGE